MSHVYTRERHKNKNTRFWATYDMVKIRESCFKSHIPVPIKVEYGKMFFVE